MRTVLVLILVVALLPFVGNGPARRRNRRHVRQLARRRARRATGRLPLVAPLRRLRRRLRLARHRYHPTWLYRLPAALPCPNPSDGRYRDAEGHVGEHLYVGVAKLGRLRKRWRQHRGLDGNPKHRRKVWAWRVIWWLPLPVLPGIRWWGVFPSVRLYSTRVKAEAAERKAIAEELPVYNVAGARPRRATSAALRRTP